MKTRIQRIFLSVLSVFLFVICLSGSDVHAGRETCVSISPNSAYVTACDKHTGIVSLFSISSAVPLWTKDLDAFSVATSNNGYVIVGERGDEVHLYNSAGMKTWSYSDPAWQGRDYIRVDIEYDGSGVVAANDDPDNTDGCSLCYFHDGGDGWDGADGTPAWRFDPSDDPNDDFYSVSISSDGWYIATGPSDYSYVFNRTSNVPLQSLAYDGGVSYDLTYFGQHGACGDAAGTLHLFSPGAGTIWSKSVGGDIRSVGIGHTTVSADVTIAVGSTDGYVRVYDLAGAELFSFDAHTNIASVAVSHGGNYVAVGSLGCKLYLFTRDGTKLWEHDVPVAYGGNCVGSESRSVAISAYGGYVVAGCTDALYVFRNDGGLHWTSNGDFGIIGNRKIQEMVPVLLEPATSGNPSSSSPLSQAALDTFYFGGTVWDALDGRWEAAPPAAAGWANRKTWTIESPYEGVPDGLESPDALPDGWQGVDVSTDSRDCFRVMDNAKIGACVISGQKSLFCGETNSRCLEQCYGDVTGTGYGNNWNQIVATKGYFYEPGFQVFLTYDYASETEMGGDCTYVILQIDPGGGMWLDYARLRTYEGLVSGTEVIDLSPYLLSVSGIRFRVKFQFRSDGGWSDADGLNPTSCGAVSFDNYALTGDVSDSEDFEDVCSGGLPPGWMKIVEERCIDLARTGFVGSLPDPIASDPCVYGIPGWCDVADELIAFYESGGPSCPHPLWQDNYIQSPVIDLSPYPGVAGRYLSCDVFAYLSLADHVLMYWMVRYKPGCASDGWGAWLTDNQVYYTSEGFSCFNWVIDMSPYVPPHAELVQIALGVVNLCDEDPWGLGCSYVCNSTPYFDNITFGLFGLDEAPYIGMREIDYWQDQFAEDGTLNPASVADTRTPNYHSDLVPPIYGDTLVCRGSATNMEVHFVFRMAKVGPSQATTDDFFGHFPGVTGGGWFSAEMDTCEITSSDGTYTLPLAEWWMCAFHEDEGYGEGLEILPNAIFVPGTRIEYFLKANYVSTPGVVFTLPDTTGGIYEEFEVLPMMRDDGAGSVEWPCLIVADHFGQRGNWYERNSDRIARHLTALGYSFDMYNKLAPSSVQRNGIGRYAANPGQIGGPGTDKYNWGSGATLAQFVGYKHCILNSGSVYDLSLSQQDAAMFTSWMVYLSGSDYVRTLWVSGDQICREMNRRTPWGPEFLNTVLCLTYVGWSYSDVYSDFTYCLPMNGLVGSIDCTPKSHHVRMNGCPKKLNEIGVSGAGGCNASAEVEYDSQGTPVIAGVSNVVSIVHGANYKTYTEGYDFCLIRDDDSLWPSWNCGPDGFIATWMTCVQTWMGCYPSDLCGPFMVVDVTEPGAVPPAFVTSLSQAFPNPMNPTATIEFSIGAPGKVMLRVFDVSGRVIKTLVNENRDAGDYRAIWDGKSDRGERVASGVFFYQLDAPDFKSAKKIVILQ